MNDTIAAIATATGGGLGVIRISGPQALAAATAVFHGRGQWLPRLVRYGHVVDAGGNVLDEALAFYMPGPHSYTGEDVVELQGHGGQAGLSAILETLLALPGLRMAEAGEFTRRAFLNGRMDLTRAEAVAEIISAPGAEGVRLAAAKLQGLLGEKVESMREAVETLRRRLMLELDFLEEETLNRAEIDSAALGIAKEIQALAAGYERARPWSEGALVVLAGKVNVGKSSLMNALLGRPRAIVTAQAGTTRDYLEESTFMDGLPVRLVDTAGLRHYTPEDPIEAEGIRRGREMLAQAQAALIVIDAPHNLEAEAALAGELGAGRCLLVWNKCDIAPAKPSMLPPALHALPLAEVCARSGKGLDALCFKVREICAGQAPQPGDIQPNRRQAAALASAAEEIAQLLAAPPALPPELLALHLESAALHLARVTGFHNAEENANEIFASFCIGK